MIHVTQQAFFRRKNYRGKSIFIGLNFPFTPKLRPFNNKKTSEE
jgi:hypothetical protein